MRIRVLINFGGRLTRERRIEPGEYDADDPRLFGAADYLLNNGHAVVVEDEPEAADVDEMSTNGGHSPPANGDDEDETAHEPAGEATRAVNLRRSPKKRGKK